MPPPPAPPLTPRVAQKCRDLVFAAAKRHKIPPVFVTAHVPSPAAHRARLEVQRSMVGDLKLRRWQVAEIFGRDLRRLRKSVIGV